MFTILVAGPIGQLLYPRNQRIIVGNKPAYPFRNDICSFLTYMHLDSVKVYRKFKSFNRSFIDRLRFLCRYLFFMSSLNANTSIQGCIARTQLHRRNSDCLFGSHRVYGGQSVLNNIIIFYKTSKYTLGARKAII